MTTEYKYRYEDESGKRWNGAVCPGCTAQIKKLAYKVAPRVDHGDQEDFQYKLRNCKKCQKELPPTLYFVHKECRGFDWTGIASEVI